MTTLVRLSEPEVPEPAGETHEVVDEVLLKIERKELLNSYTISDTSSVRRCLPPSPTGEG